MTNEELDKLYIASRIGMGVYTPYQDSQLKPKFHEVLAYLKGAGVHEETLSNESCVGVISQGMSDLWAFGAGNTKLSPYFHERAAQIVLNQDGDSNG